MTRDTVIGGMDRLQAKAPSGWNLLELDDGWNDVILVGPRDTQGVRARIEVRREPVEEGETIETVSRQLMKELQQERPDALLVACDIWPHPRWGLGRLVQSAFTVDRAAVAHDRYLFVEGGCAVMVSVDCLLQDLLPLEAGVAEIVASIAPTRAA